jgi:hypothetical protein
MLLEVYMKAGDAKVTEASRLLNAQAVNLDTEDVSNSAAKSRYRQVLT